MRIFGLAGWSGSGKTTLLTALIPELVGAGSRCRRSSTRITNSTSTSRARIPGVHRQAGASEVMVASARRWALMHELRGAPEPTLDELVARMAPVDLLLVEGFKRAPHPKLEVHRPSLGKPLLYPDDPHIVAIASDEALAAPLPVLPLWRCRGDRRFHPRIIDGLERMAQLSDDCFAFGGDAARRRRGAGADRRARRARSSATRPCRSPKRPGRILGADLVAGMRRAAARQQRGRRLRDRPCRSRRPIATRCCR